MSNVKRSKYGHVRMLIVLLCLNACTTVNFEPNCAIFPIAGPAVARELEKADYDTFPKTWEWIGRLYKLKTELDMCSENWSSDISLSSHEEP